MNIITDNTIISSQNGIFSLEYPCSYSPNFNDVSIYIPVHNLSNIPITGGSYPPININVIGSLIDSVVIFRIYIAEQNLLFYPDNSTNPSYYIGTLKYKLSGFTP